ncbi:DUF5063 domain-containing protein [Pelagicoccus sp. SDUM812003]|uniref:DUF5063 domain-containing protein n=1 Tax=Pelagicoccus sp. SDUM812003 TaxID=3041267 RepID=UPI00280D83AC|nr:DUF5063 domain-containing protein [Pelagicoccus sp. SDUM812003]MDQ8203969.1 DUF5063 domain-containing protein [Pelagicoccus sp. SDUM812003]
MESEAKAFLATVSRFIEWIETGKHDLISARELLVDLIKDIHRLEKYRDFEPMDDEFERREHEGWKEDIQKLKDLPFQYYAEIFDPHNFEKAEVVTGDLMDDFADIYGDLYVANQALKKGYETEALRISISMYFMHWGYHVNSALRAIDEFYIHYYESEPGSPYNSSQSLRD